MPTSSSSPVVRSSPPRSGARFRPRVGNLVASSVLLLLGLALALTGCAESPPAEPLEVRPSWATRGAPHPFWLGGIQVNEADHGDWFDALRDRGFDTVAVTDYAHQGDWSSDHLWWDEESPWVDAEIEGAKRAGLEVVLVLRVALDHAFPVNDHLWHGMILPLGENAIASWFERYTEFVLRWAASAEASGVDILVVGSEMNALTSTLPLDGPPGLESWYLDEVKQAERRETTLAARELLGESAFATDGRPLEEFLEDEIATQRAWARAHYDAALADYRRAVAEGRAAPPRSSGSPEESAETPIDPDVAELLAALDHRRQVFEGHWRTLVERTREVYTGPLGYAANFDQYHEVGFWDALDVMGVNAYFELRERIYAQEPAERLAPLLLDGWRGVLEDMVAFRQEHDLDLPVVFTELGYTWRARSSVKPWADPGFGYVVDNADPETDRPIVWRDEPERRDERALAVKALHQAHEELNDPFLSGILYWKLTSHEYHRPIESFVVVIGPEADEPILRELKRFVEPDVDLDEVLRGHIK